ncbi:MAG TPA: hypothetical protein VFO36_10285 [Nitrospiraceae bacterium]|nr:hypothetical protein [Nitrospiraceae bacterium]
MTHHVREPSGRYYRCYLMRNEHIVEYQEVFSYDDDAGIEGQKRF